MEASKAHHAGHWHGCRLRLILFQEGVCLTLREEANFHHILEACLHVRECLCLQFVVGHAVFGLDLVERFPARQFRLELRGRDAKCFCKCVNPLLVTR